MSRTYSIYFVIETESDYYSPTIRKVYIAQSDDEFFDKVKKDATFYQYRLKSPKTTKNLLKIFSSTRDNLSLQKVIIQPSETPKTVTIFSGVDKNIGSQAYIISFWINTPEDEVLRELLANNLYQNIRSEMEDPQSEAEMLDKIQSSGFDDEDGGLPNHSYALDTFKVI
jgi:hypothetical protein